MADRVVLVELNEVPNFVLDAYARTSSFMREFLEASARYETISPDLTQLDPWIAWPTFHRGVEDKAHGLLRLGQDTRAADAAYPPIWRILRENGLKVGVYGSLLSNAEEELDGYAFFVPDVFSHHSRVNPPDLQRFQDFNLRMTRASARNADRGVAGGGGRAVADLARRGRIAPSTLGRLAAQLAAERVNPPRVSRRRNLQTELHGDIFCSLLRETRPDFATFYTNNVAAAMHRFWSAAFPATSINAKRLDPRWVETYRDEVFAALRTVERIVRRIMRESEPGTAVVLASALGQHEIPAENHRAFLSIVDADAFVSALLEREAPAAYEIRPTMVPDLTVRFSDAADAEAASRRLSTLRIDRLQAVETLQRMHMVELVAAGTPLAHIRHDYGDGDHFKHEITFGRSDPHTLHVSLQVDDYTGPSQAYLGNVRRDFSELGLGIMSHDEGVNCTAQHCAEGALAVYGAGRGEELRLISTLDFVPSVLRHFGVAPGEHLRGAPSIDFAGRR